MKNISKMLCFMDSEDLYELAKEIINGETDVKLEKLFPYMDSEHISELVKDIVEKDVDVSYVAMACFMDEEDVYNLARLKLERDPNFNVRSLLPFMSEKDVDKICRQLADDEKFHCDISLSEMYAFASNGGVDELFLRYAKQGKLDESALPYVSEKCLHQFVEEYCENPDLNLNIDALYPYLSGKDMSLLLRTYLKRRKNN